MSTVTRTAYVATVVALGVLAGGCGDGGQSSSAPASAATSASTTPTAQPTASAASMPETGRCHRITYDQAVAPTEDLGGRACSGPHTSETYAVGRVDDVVAGHLVAIDSDHVQEQVATTCPAGLPRFVGGTTEERRLSMVRAVWFTPTVEASDAGADWYRCDAVVLAGPERLARVKGSLKRALDTDAGRARYAMCSTAEPGTAGFTRVLCSGDHSWRAISVVDLGTGRYPGTADVRSRGQDPCAAAGRDVAADPLDYRWAYEFPTQDDWDAGQTYGRCWAPG